MDTIANPLVTVPNRKRECRDLYMKIMIAESSTAMGGQELAVVRHAKGLSERGHDIQLLLQPGSPIARSFSRKGLISCMSTARAIAGWED